MTFMLIVVGLILLLIIWLGLDFSLGRKQHLSKVRKAETAMLHGQLDIFTHGKELFADFFDVLEQAEHHIHVLFYIVKDDSFGQEFFQLLMKKAREGVEIRLVVDRLGSLGLKKAAVQTLREAGIQFAFCDRVKPPFLFYTSQVRNHRKISIIDGKIGYLGGFNIGKEYIDQDPKLSPWRDYHLKITGEGVQFLQSEFMIDWKRCTGEKLHGQPGYFPNLAAGAVRHQFVPTEAGLLMDRFTALIRTARHEITIGTPYFIPNEAILAELLSALGRGVRLTIIVPYTADHLLVQEASYRYLRKLIRAGALVYQYKKGFYHAKTIVIDDKVCDIGTANFDQRSLFLNKEINCYIYNSDFVDRLKDILDKDILDSDLLTLEALTKFNPLRSVKEAVAGALAYFL